MWNKKTWLVVACMAFAGSLLAQRDNMVLSQKTKSDTTISSNRIMTVVTTTTKVIKLGRESTAWTETKTPTTAKATSKRTTSGVKTPVNRFNGMKDSIGANGVHYHVDTSRPDNDIIPQ